MSETENNLVDQNEDIQAEEEIAVGENETSEDADESEEEADAEVDAEEA
jgi:hypothetical protein